MARESFHSCVEKYDESRGRVESHGLVRTCRLPRRVECDTPAHREGMKLRLRRGHLFLLMSGKSLDRKAVQSFVAAVQASKLLKAALA